jgi:hypothetical protein
MHYSVNKGESTSIVMEVNTHRTLVSRVDDCLKCEISVEHRFGWLRKDIADKKDHPDHVVCANRLTSVGILSSDAGCCRVRVAILDESIRLSNESHLSSEKRD